MTLGTIGTDDEEMFLVESDRIWLYAVGSKIDRSSDTNVIVVAHQLGDAVGSVVRDRAEIALEL